MSQFGWPWRIQKKFITAVYQTGPMSNRKKLFFWVVYPADAQRDEDGQLDNAYILCRSPRDYETKESAITALQLFQREFRLTIPSQDAQSETAG